MDKNQILDYVMDSPGNTNRAVLSGMLDSIGGGDNEEWTLIYEGDVDMSTQASTIKPTKESICLNTNYRRSLYKIYFDDKVVYSLPFGINSSSLAGYTINNQCTSYDFNINMYSTKENMPVKLTSLDLSYYYYSGPAKTMHIKIYQSV